MKPRDEHLGDFVVVRGPTGIRWLALLVRFDDRHAWVRYWIDGRPGLRSVLGVQQPEDPARIVSRAPNDARTAAARAELAEEAAPHIAKAAKYLAQQIDGNALNQFSGTPVEVEAWRVVLEAYGERATLAQAQALLRDLTRRGLLVLNRKRYYLGRAAVLDDHQLGDLVAAELRSEGHHERFVDVLAKESAALALVGLHGQSAVERLERLRASPAVRLDYLVGRARLYLAAA